MAGGKKAKMDFVLWAVQRLIGALRFYFRVKEKFAPPAKQQKLHAFREKMDVMERDKKELFREMKNANPDETFALVEAFEERYHLERSPELTASRVEHREKMRRMREETETLGGILRAHGNDTEEAARELRGYLADHPGSGSAYSYLGMVLQKRRDWNASLAAFAEAERLEGSDTMSGVMARLHTGDVLQKKGDVEAALAQYQDILNTATPNMAYIACLVHFSMGNAWQAQGNRAKARAAWKQAARLDETDTIAKFARQKLKESG